MKASMIVRIILCVVLMGGIISRVEAQSLSSQLNNLFGESGVFLASTPTTPVEGAGVPTVIHDAHFTSESLATFDLLVQQLAPNAADFPAVSTTPGFVFRFDPQSGEFERVSTSLGSVFVERPQTLGRGKLDFGVTYLYINFTELDGDDLDSLQFTGLEHNDCCPERPNLGTPSFEQDTADIVFQKFNLTSHIVSFFATYGITDRWDVNIYVPVVFTSLEVRAVAQLNDESGTGTHFFDEGQTQTTQVSSIDDNKTGIGDILLRTKYHVLNTNGLNLAPGLVLRVPTGDEDDFQGLGDTTLTPFVAFSYEYKFIEFHVSSGVDINFDELDRSRVRYAGGVSLTLIEQLAIFADIIGSSSLKSTEVSTTVSQFVNAAGTGSATPSEVGEDNISDVQTVSVDIKTDIIDLSVGVKANFYGSLVGFAGVLVPLNNDGLRADVIPTVGLDISF